MKNKFKSFLSILLLMMIITFKPIMVSAQTIEQDNLKVNLKVEKADSINKEVKVKVKLKNSGIRAVENINIQSYIPNEFKIKEGQALSKEIGTLEAGESCEYEFYCELDEALIPDSEEGGNESNNNNGNVNGDNSTSDNNGNDSIINNEDSNNDAVGSGQQEGPKKDFINSVKSGDYNNVLMLSGAAIISVGVIIYLSKRKGKRARQILSIFMCFTLLSSIIGSNTLMVKAESLQKKEISISENITINDKQYTVKTIVSYENKESTVKPSGKVITRGEWISKLVNVMELKNKQELKLDDLEPLFKDIENHYYKEDIMYAKIYSIIDNKDENFYPDEPATREFTAVTSVKALGFEPLKDIICDDSSEIKSLKEVETAVSMNLIALENNKFYPGRSLTEGESKYVLDGVQAVLKSTEIDENHEDIIEFKDGVIEFKEDIAEEVNETSCKLKLNDETKNLKKDDKFVITNKKACKAVGIEIKDDSVIVETVKPEVEEIFENIDIEGHATADISEFIAEDGVKVIQDNSEKGKSIKADKLSLALNYSYNGLEITGDIVAKVPKLEMKIDMELGKIHNNFVKLPLEVESNLSINVNFAGIGDEKKEGGKIKLGKVPVAAAYGAVSYLTFYLEYSISGEITFKLTAEGEVGIQITNNRLRFIDRLEVEAEREYKCEAKIGPAINLDLEFLDVCLMDFEARVGGASNITYLNEMYCKESTMHVYFEIEALNESVIKKFIDEFIEAGEGNIAIKASIWNEKSSPIKTISHSENGEVVPECTYKYGTIAGSIVDSKDNNKIIKNAKVQFYDIYSDELVKETISDENGKYSVTIPNGTYRIVISKSGYKTVELIEILLKRENKSIKTCLTADENQESGSEGSNNQGIFDGNKEDYSTLIVLDEKKADINNDNIEDNVLLYGDGDESSLSSTGKIVVIIDGKTSEVLTSFNIYSGWGHAIEEIIDATGDGVKDIRIFCHNGGQRGGFSEGFIFKDGTYKNIKTSEVPFPSATMEDNFIGRVSIPELGVNITGNLNEKEELISKNIYSENGKLVDPSNNKLYPIQGTSLYKDEDNDGVAEYIDYELYGLSEYTWLVKEFVIKTVYKYDKQSGVFEFKKAEIVTAMEGGLTSTN